MSLDSLDYQLVQRVVQDKGLEQFTLGQFDDLVTLCREFMKRKVDAEVAEAVREGLGRDTVLYLKRIGVLAR